MSLLEELKAISPDYARAAALLPPSLMLKKINYYRASSDVVEQKRAAFKNIRADFLRHTGEHCVQALRDMGLNDYAITRMRDEGRMPANTAGEQLDCTVDHVISLNFGGMNTIDNLILLPAAMNKLKNDIERAQFTSAAYGEAITILPVDPEVKVPYVPGGFQKAKKLAVA